MATQPPLGPAVGYTRTTGGGENQHGSVPEPQSSERSGLLQWVTFGVRVTKGMSAGLLCASSGLSSLARTALLRGFSSFSPGYLEGALGGFARSSIHRQNKPPWAPRKVCVQLPLN